MQFSVVRQSLYTIINRRTNTNTEKKHKFRKETDIQKRNTNTEKKHKYRKETQIQKDKHKYIRTNTNTENKHKYRKETKIQKRKATRQLSYRQKDSLE